MIDLLKILRFAKNQWLGVIVLLLWITHIIFMQMSDSRLVEETKALDKIIIKEKLKIDTLYKTNTIIDNKIKYIKIVTHDTIKIIDTMRASVLQKYFTDRYNK